MKNKTFIFKREGFYHYDSISICKDFIEIIFGKTPSSIKIEVSDHPPYLPSKSLPEIKWYHKIFPFFIIPITELKEGWLKIDTSGTLVKVNNKTIGDFFSFSKGIILDRQRSFIAKHLGDKNVFYIKISEI